MRIRFVQNIINRIRTEIDELYTDSFKLFYFGNSKHNNAGDMFNENLMKHFNIKFRKTRISNANLTCVGSVLDSLFINKDSNLPHIKSDLCTIIGSGFIKPPETPEKLIKKVNIKALRGKLSYERFLNAGINMDNIVFADPGILASYIYPINCEKKYKLGIIPHYVDKNSKYLNNIQLDKENYIIIDIEQSVEKVLFQINQCDCILSSSLHGLIFADSYNIPNRQIILSDSIIGGTYKFEDYYSAFDIKIPEIIDLRNSIINDNMINLIKTTYIPKVELITSAQEKLIKIFKEIGTYNNDKK